MKGFINFIREQGVVGLAVGFILGGAVSKLVAAFVSDLINPILGIILGMAGNLEEATLVVGPIKILWGDFVASLIDFLVIAVVVYFGFKILKLMKLHGLKPVVSSPLSSAELSPQMRDPVVAGKSAEAEDFRIHPRP